MIVIQTQTMTNAERIWPETALPRGEFLRIYAEMTDVDMDTIRNSPGMPLDDFDALLEERAGITPELADALAKALDTPDYFWKNVQSNYEQHLQVIAEREDAESDLPLLKHFPYKSARKLGWLPRHSDPRDRVRTLRQFFGVATLRDVQLPEPTDSRRNGSGVLKSDTPHALAMWLRKQELDAAEQAAGATAAPLA